MVDIVPVEANPGDGEAAWVAVPVDDALAVCAKPVPIEIRKTLTPATPILIVEIFLSILPPL
jgi:hypothetical protein